MYIFFINIYIRDTRTDKRDLKKETLSTRHLQKRPIYIHKRHLEKRPLYIHKRHLQKRPLYIHKRHLYIYTQETYTCTNKHNGRLENFSCERKIPTKKTYQKKTSYVQKTPTNQTYKIYARDLHVYSLLHLECHLSSISNLNLPGLFSTERGKRDLEN